MEVDWPELRALAANAAESAHAPYSGLRVGAGAVTTDGRLISGCNVENASYGLTLCAECGVVSALHASGGGVIHAISIMAGDGKKLMPCGRCRQLLVEASAGAALVDADPQPICIDQLLPHSFGAGDIEQHRDA